MKIIIVGAGDVGFHIAQKLSEENHDVALIDKDANHIKRVGETLDAQTFLGSGTSPEYSKTPASMVRTSWWPPRTAMRPT